MIQDIKFLQNHEINMSPKISCQGVIPALKEVHIIPLKQYALAVLRQWGGFKMVFLVRSVLHCTGMTRKQLNYYPNDGSWVCFTCTMPQFSDSFFVELSSNDCDLISSHEDLNENLEDPMDWSDAAQGLRYFTQSRSHEIQVNLQNSQKHTKYHKIW